MIKEITDIDGRWVVDVEGKTRCLVQPSALYLSKLSAMPKIKPPEELQAEGRAKWQSALATLDSTTLTKLKPVLEILAEKLKFS